MSNSDPKFVAPKLKKDHPQHHRATEINLPKEFHGGLNGLLEIQNLSVAQATIVLYVNDDAGSSPSGDYGRNTQYSGIGF